MIFPFNELITDKEQVYGVFKEEKTSGKHCQRGELMLMMIPVLKKRKQRRKKVSRFWQAF